MSNRVQYNMDLARTFLESRGIASLFPSVPGEIVNQRAISPFGYNPSIIHYEGRTLMAYRWHHQGDWHTQLAMAEIRNGAVVSNKKIEVAGPSCEDPRLFKFKGDLYISFVVSNGSVDAGFNSVIRYGRIEEAGGVWTVDGQHLVVYGKNDGTGIEKNWVFFEHNNALWCLYSQADKQVAIRIENGKVVEELSCDAASWKWGAIRGGTAPLKYRGDYLRFFHSKLTNEPPPFGWRYYVGAVLCDTKPPFRVKQISKKPVLRGSEIDNLDDGGRRGCRHWKGNVVFPAGVIDEEDGWTISVGVNDSQCVLTKLTEGDLNL